MRGHSRPTGGIDAPDAPPKNEKLVAGHLDVDVPTTPEAVEWMINQGFARALEMATSAKELTETLKVAVEWWGEKYGTGDGDGGLGSNLTGARSNGHGG